MKRRTLIKMPAVLPLANIRTTNEIRATLLVDQATPINLIIQSHPTTAAAERYRRSWTNRVWENPKGEWYTMHSEHRELPEHLAQMPGSLSYHETLYGEAADPNDYLTGAFRRDHISCIVRVRDADETLMLEIAEHIAAQEIPGLFESAWSPGFLRRFIPDEHSLGVPVEPDTWHFP